MKTPSDEKLMKSFILQFTGRGQDMRQPEKCQRHHALVVRSASVQVPPRIRIRRKDCSTSLVELLRDFFACQSDFSLESQDSFYTIHGGCSLGDSQSRLGLRVGVVRR